MNVTAPRQTKNRLRLFPQFQHAPWWQAASLLQEALAAGADPAELASIHADLVARLAAGGFADLAHAAALELLQGDGPLAAYARSAVPAGLITVLESDLGQLHDVAHLGAQLTGMGLPPLTGLAAPYPPGVEEGTVDAALRLVREAEPGSRTEQYLTLLSQRGTGPAALYPALTWRDGGLAGVGYPDLPSWDQLALLTEQLERLERNARALLAGGAHHVLLYGPRGSGKSTAVRGLLGRFATQGLRLVELPPAGLGSLPDLVEQLRRQPTSFVIFVDDLAFEADDAGYRPLKSLLEGSLVSRPANVIVVATSNRRHLIQERLSDRPAPEDDVHGWDTHHERLALADRFGLTITFPSAGQRSYLEMVRALAALRGVGSVDPEQAVRFAEWGNGYSGRTARQYVDDLAYSRAVRASKAASS